MEENSGFFGGCSPCSPCCSSKDDTRLNLKVQADQPVISVPVYQDVLRRDKFVEVPHVTVQDTLIPTVYNQETLHDVPQADITYSQLPVDVESYKYVKKDVPVSVPMGYTPKFVPTWDVREVPKPVPKYEGEQKIIEVDVPVIKYQNKYVDKEVIVQVKEKIVPKITEVEKPVEVIKYEWKEEVQDVPVYKYVSKFDVELDCPPPLIVPYPENKVVKVPPIQEKTADFSSYNFCSSCCGQDYINESAAQGIPHTHETEFGINQLNSQIDYSQLGVQEGIPLYPLQSPQYDPANQVPELYGGESDSKKGKSEKWFCWPFCKQSPCEPEEEDPYPGYPKDMPKDFADYFKAKEYEEAAKKQYSKFEEKTGSEPEIQKLPSELEPKVEYKGSIKKPSVFGGNLDPITFKLHAIEVHQFIALPDMEPPKFVQTLPEFDISKRAELESLFGPVPEGWADPGITGMPAPIMCDILQGNYQMRAKLSSMIGSEGTSNDALNDSSPIPLEQNS